MHQHRNSVSLTIGMILCFLLMKSAPLFAQEVLYVNNTLVNLRSGPTTAADNILTAVPEDTPVELISRQGSWYQVRLPDGREGWISSWVLTAPPETPPTSSEPTLPQEEKTGRALPLDAMILIPAGTAIIGSDEQELVSLAQTWNVSLEMFQDEVPRTMVTINSFYIDQYEVTNKQYKAFVEATRYPPPLHWKNGMYPEGTADHPVTYVSWDDAQAYAQWAGKRLPTAEEWEAAARGLQGQTYPWGPTFAGQQINLGNIKGGPASVGTHPDDVSPYQVYDMGGNVMEWTLTQYQGQNDFFILKGSSWSGESFEARGANKTPGQAIYQLGHIGFRCAKSATE